MIGYRLSADHVTHLYAECLPTSQQHVLLTLPLYPGIKGSENDEYDEGYYTWELANHLSWLTMCDRCIRRKGAAA